MQTNRQYIESLCQDIQQKGKTPTVGLIRSRTTIKLSVKEVIEGLKYWKANPESDTSSQPSPNVSDNNDQQTLENRVTELERQVIELQQQLENLINNRC